jgi:hypothetical protein
MSSRIGGEGMRLAEEVGCEAMVAHRGVDLPRAVEAVVHIRVILEEPLADRDGFVEGRS